VRDDFMPVTQEEALVEHPERRSRQAGTSDRDRGVAVAGGRRERNKEEKRDRILAAATELFASQGVDEVTTQQIADAADIGTGTLFLYAKNKGELLLMVQNALYADALEAGTAAAETEQDPVDAVMAVVTPIVHCNRAHVGNGRAYLREMTFGDPAEPHHARALEIVNQTEIELARTLLRTTQRSPQTSEALARIISALLLRYLAPAVELGGDSPSILAHVREDLSRVLAGT